MVDLFDEVEENLRTDRYRSIALRLAPWISGALVLALLVALGFWGYQSWQDRRIAQASEAYDTALQRLTQGDQTGAFSRFGDIARTAPPTYAALAMMHQGAIRLEANQRDEAVQFFDRAANRATDPLISDLAALRAVYILLDTGSYADLERRITPLAAEGRPYRPQAQEALAMAKLLAGRSQEARAAFQTLRLNLDTPEDVQRRAQTAIALIESGRTEALRAAVRAAATMPPPSAANVPTLPGAPPQEGAPAARPGTAQ